MITTAVIGKNYGDEGKGLVTAGLCSFMHRSGLSDAKPLIIKHNGGAQAGHTVEDKEKKTRFIHHQTGSGAEYGADTLFAESYHPDLYQLGKEMEEFEEKFGFIPRILSEAETKMTTIDDVLLNMAVETGRGERRHGSCGMGINECVERNGAGYAVTVGELTTLSFDRFIRRLKTIREEYTVRRMRELGIDGSNKYYTLLCDENVLENFADGVLKNLSYVEIVDAGQKWLEQYERLIFETGQGLLLDQDLLQNAPHLTSSKTGITMPVEFLKKRNMELNEAIYVTRSYVTRHGAGPLPNEFEREEYGNIEKDITNEPNEWQGKIRYARHTDIAEFTKYIFEDIRGTGIKPSLAVTHLNETDDKILFKDEDMPLEKLVQRLDKDFESIFISRDRYIIEKYMKL